MEAEGEEDVASVHGNLPGQEAKWWHVPDNKIADLVQNITQGADDGGQVSSEKKNTWPRRNAPKPIRRVMWGETGTLARSASFEPLAEAPVKLTPQDALDLMLRRMAGTEPQRRKDQPTEPGGEDDDEDYDFENGGDITEASRPSKWWHVSDRKLREHVERVKEETTERQLARMDKSAMRATIDGSSASTSGPTSPSCSVDSPLVRKGIHVRLHTLGRSEPIPCHRTGRRHRAMPPGEASILIPVYFHMVDTGIRFSLDVHPDLRIGPDQPPSANRFTEKFGLGARTNGFELKAQSFDYQRRRWAAIPRPNWEPAWRDSLKAQIEMATGVEASRQKLLMHGCYVSTDSSTVRIAGITPGVEMQVFTKKTDAQRDQRNVALASTAKRLEVEERAAGLEESKLRMEASAKENTTAMRATQVDSPKQCVMPPWKSQEMPNLFGGKQKGGVTGDSRDRKTQMVPSFEEVGIFRPDVGEQQLQRVRSLPCYTLTAARW